MPFRLIRHLAALAVALAAFPSIANAADTSPRACLSKEAQRAAVADRRAMPLADAVKTVQRHKGDLVRARLCQGPNGLVYVLTLLSRNGKVTRTTLDAASGSVVSGR